MLTLCPGDVHGDMPVPHIAGCGLFYMLKVLERYQIIKSVTDLN